MSKIKDNSSYNLNLSEFLINNGYLDGDLSDFINESEYEELKKYSLDIRNFFKEYNDTIVRCRYNYHSNLNTDYTHDISVRDIEDRKLEILNNNYIEIQRWRYLPVNTTNSAIETFFYKISKKIINKLYPLYNVDMRYSDSNFTLFKKDDFIEPHTDSTNEGRLCVLLIYLNDYLEYKENGGEIVLETNETETIQISPVFGKFVVLDFSKNNLQHSVLPVKNDFNRYSFNSFITYKL